MAAPTTEINWHITSGTLRCRVLSGTDLAPKGSLPSKVIHRSGKSDPYVLIGMADMNGKLMKKPHIKKSEIIHQTLNPVWKEAFFTTKLPVPLSDTLKIELFQYFSVIAAYRPLLYRDDDTLGNDDFDGECFIDLGTIPENQMVQRDVQLKSRPGKKDKISGYLTVELYIISDKLREKLGPQELKNTAATRLSVDTRRAGDAETTNE